MSKRSKSRKTKTNLDAERLTPSGLPADFLVRLETIVDDTWRESVLRSFEAAKKTSFRVNTLFTEPGEVLTELQELGGAVEEDSVRQELRQRVIALVEKLFDVDEASGRSF